MGTKLSRRSFAAGAAVAAALGTTRGLLAQEADEALQDEDSGDTATENPEAGQDTDAADEAEDEVADSPAREPEAVDPYSLEEGAGLNYLNAFDDRITQTTWLPTATYMLPLGCNVFADCDTRAATIQSHEGGHPFTVAGVLEYQTGLYTIILPAPFSGSSFCPSEIHMTDAVMAWVEVDNITDEWVLYAGPATTSVIASGSAGYVRLGEGTSEWLPPQVAVAGTSVVWQVMPDPYGPYAAQSSKCYRWSLGGSVASEVWSSPGRFACPPSLNEGVLTIVPRLEAKSGVYYGITALDMIDGREKDQVLMPASVRPFRATCIAGRFAFSVEANYGYGGLLGRMGYYFGTGEGPFDYVAREPSAQVCAVGGRYIVRSQLSYFVIDPPTYSYSRLSAVSNCVDYGDYPATCGTASRFVTYTSVKDSITGVPANVCVRVFDMPRTS